MIGQNNWLKVLVQPVNQRDCSGDIQADNLVLRHIVQILDKRPQGVTMGSNDYSFSFHQDRGNSALPVRQDTLDCQCQRLCQRQGARWQILVSRVKLWVIWIVILDWWWWNKTCATLLLVPLQTFQWFLPYSSPEDHHTFFRSGSMISRRESKEGPFLPMPLPES